MKVYEKIFARLDELSMSQSELSRRTGISTSTIKEEDQSTGGQAGSYL